MSSVKSPDDDTSTLTDDNEEIPLTADGRVPFWYTARMMAKLDPVDDDPDFWDRWKDEMKDGL